MRIVFSLVLLAVAVILLKYGLDASESIASTVERAVSGTPSDRSIWFFVGSAVLGVVGLLGLVTRGPHAQK
jgi:uncharacterized membrane protein